MTGAQRRSQLIEIGRGLFAIRGLDGTTIEEVAAAAGVSKPVIYEHFGSKEGLIRSLIAHLHEWQGDVLEAGHVGDMDGLDALCAFVWLHCASTQAESESAAYFMLLAAAVADRLETRTAFAESHELERVLIRAFIERGQKSGHIRRDINADAEALMVGCNLLGLRMQCLIDPLFDPAPVRDALIAALRDHLRISNGGGSRR